MCPHSRLLRTKQAVTTNSAQNTLKSLIEKLRQKASLFLALMM